jgi:hypothetical protein
MRKDVSLQLFFSLMPPQAPPRRSLHLRAVHQPLPKNLSSSTPRQHYPTPSCSFPGQERDLEKSRCDASVHQRSRTDRLTSKLRPRSSHIHRRLTLRWKGSSGRENDQTTQGRRERYAPYTRRYLRRTIVRLLLVFICRSLAISACHP